MDAKRREAVDRKMAQFKAAWGNAERAKTYRFELPKDLHATTPRCQHCGNLEHRCRCEEADNDQMGTGTGGRHVYRGAVEPPG